ncbi:tripartite tricarboxylate transporter substrate binding protein [Alkalihalobacillus deserti]|uniref:tripartite tricarboxylate transporter substrate binding protein n=1 Tax=Alkalihalobacillus deserti TaxID=2879466 RepID=UPI001D1459E6|nr:tripartite tricarboxylate transporter substrate binding protein [Alkalihalobacillus deserti]
MTRKKLLILAFVVVYSLILTACGNSEVSSSGDSGEKFPDETIKILVGYEPGGGTDTGARILARELSEYFDVDVVVENKPGGSGVVAMTELINANANGYTIGFSPNGPLTLQPNYGQTTYDYNAAVPISQVGSVDFFLAVHKDAPWDNIESFIKDVQNNPGKFSYGMPGAGSIGEIAMKSLAEETGIDMKKVPFQGGTPTRTALLAKDVEAVAINEDSLIPFAESGELKILMNFGQKKFDSLPDIPTANEKGYDINLQIGFTLFGPKELPNEIRDTIDEAVRNIMEDKSIQEEFEKIGLPPIYQNAEKTKRIIEEEYLSNKEVIENNKE